MADTPFFTANDVAIQALIRFQYQAVARPVLTDGQLTDRFESRWHQPWSEPIRQKIAPALAVALMTSGLIAPVFEKTLEPGSKYESTWHQPWSEPVRFKPALPAALQQFQIQGPQQTPAARVGAFAAPFDTTRIIHRRQFQYQSRAWLGFTETSTIDKWLEPWSEPVVKKLYLHPALEVTRQQFVPTVVPQILNFFRRFTELPNKAKPWLPTADQPFVSTWVPQEVPLEAKWHQAWSEPSVRVLRPAAWYQPFAIDPTPLVVRNIEPWFAPLSEPIVKARLPVAWYQPFTADPITTIAVQHIAPWLYPWSEPVRLLQGLKSYLQQTTSPAAPPFPILSVRIPWFAPLNEPVMVKHWIHPRKIEYFAVETTPHLNPVSVVISATEASTDQAFFSVIVGGLMAQRANVAIREIQARSEGALSADEQKAHNEAAVSTKEFP